MGMDRAACNRDDHGGACHHSQVRYLEGANGQRGDCEGNYCNGGTYGGGSTIPGWNSRFFVRSAGATGWEGDQQEITGMEHFEALVPFDQSNLQEAVLGLSPAQCKRLCSANATCPAYNKGEMVGSSKIKIDNFKQYFTYIASLAAARQPTNSPAN